MPVDKELKNRILKYEGLQSICTVDKYSRTDPTEEEIDDLRGAINEISRLAHDTCSASDSI